MILLIKAKPNSRENRLSNENGQLVVRIHAPAHDGKANKELIEFLSETFDIPKSSIGIVSGVTSSIKRISIPDVYKSKVELALAQDRSSNL